MLMLITSLVSPAMLVIPEPAQSAEAPTGRGIERYIRRKKLDALDSYVPLVLAARQDQSMLAFPRACNEPRA